MYITKSGHTCVRMVPDPGTSRSTKLSVIIIMAESVGLVSDCHRQSKTYRKSRRVKCACTIMTELCVTLTALGETNVIQHAKLGE
jgi:hypothetical protein